MKKLNCNHLSAALALPLCLLISGCNRDNTAAQNNPPPAGTPAISANGSDTNASGANADNTRINARDRNDQTLTPGDQGENDADREMTRKIRRALVGDSNYSTAAKNVKIITANGKVTLRGPVNNDAEKAGIESIAKNAGADNVDNQLEIKTNQ